MRDWVTTPIDAWKVAFQKKGFALRAALAFSALIATLWLFGGFVLHIEARQGVVLPDPVLAMFDPVDVTFQTFVLIYSSLLVAVLYLIRYPEEFLVGVMAYTLMISLRMMMMFSVPLEPPERIIPLVDPLVQAFTSPQVLLKDLFFSGHTSTSFLMFLVVKNKTLKWIFLLSTILVGGCVLIQHVHYFLDVAAAPFFAYGAYRFAQAIQNELVGSHPGPNVG